MDALLSKGFAAYAAFWAFLFFNVGAWLLVKRLRLCFGERAQGEVTGYVARMRSRAGERRAWMPIVRFGSLQHGQREFVSRMGANPAKWPVGTRVPVAFSASDPKAAEIATPARLWLAPAAFWLLAIGTLAAALSA